MANPVGEIPLNTYTIGAAGAAGSALALSALVGLLLNPSAVSGLYHRQGDSIAQFGAVLIALAISSAAAYFGKPGTVPNKP